MERKFEGHISLKYFVKEQDKYTKGDKCELALQEEKL
jgi:hypothetical protein